LLLVYKVLVYGFKVASKFFVKSSTHIGTMIDAIMKIPITNPDEVKKRVEIVMLVAKALESMAAIGLDAAKLGAVTEMAGGTTITELFESMGSFIAGLADTLGNLVLLIVAMAANLDESQMKGVEVIATVINAIAGLAGALFSPLEAVSEMSSGMFGPSVSEVMDAVVAGLKDIMVAVKDNLPAIVDAVLESANKIKDPEAAKPKMEVIAIALGAVADFAGAIGAVADLMPEEGGGFFSKGKSMGERLEEMGSIITQVVESVKDNIGPLVQTIVGIDIGGDAAAVKGKVEVVGMAISAVADFAKVVDTITSLNIEPDSMITTVANAIQGVTGALVHESNYDFNNLFKTLAKFTPDESGLEKFDTANNALRAIGKFSREAQSISSEFMGGEWDTAVVIADMIAEAQGAITALNGIGDLDAVVALDNFASAIGTGDGQFNITNEPVNITMNVQVTMDANKVGKVLVDKSVMTTALSTAEG